MSYKFFQDDADNNNKGIILAQMDESLLGKPVSARHAVRKGGSHSGFHVNSKPERLH